MRGMALVNSTIRRIDNSIFGLPRETIPAQFDFFAKPDPNGYSAKIMRSVLALLYVLSALAATPLQAADRLDPTPRVAVISAFEPEWKALKADVEGAKSTSVNGVEFVTGKLGGRNVVLFLSGVSMVNASMTTQLALDRFNVTGIVVSGIAGGVDPSLHVGDVVVAGRWGQYLEAVFAREVDGKFDPPPFIKTPFPNYRMIFPTEFGVLSAKVGAVQLKRCTAAQSCLHDAPRLVVGGNGVSGQAFVDNAAFRQYVFATFKAQVLDMESAAVATVAYGNGVPFIAFRCLSDLAGGSHDGNEMHVFLQLASDNSAAVVQRFLTVWTPPR